MRFQRIQGQLKEKIALFINWLPVYCSCNYILLYLTSCYGNETCTLHKKYKTVSPNVEYNIYTPNIVTSMVTIPTTFFASIIGIYFATFTDISCLS